MTFNRSLFSSASGEWETPQELFDALNEEFHFTLDAAADWRTAKCTRYFGEDENALWHMWPGRVFCNPPYGRQIGDWIEHAYAEVHVYRHPEVVVMLLPARTDTRWWHDYVMKADEIRFIRGRLKFGGAKTGAPFPSCIVIFRTHGIWHDGLDASCPGGGGDGDGQAPTAQEQGGGGSDRRVVLGGRTRRRGAGAAAPEGLGNQGQTPGGEWPAGVRGEE